MCGITIFDLPTELLQKTFEYLDWDRSEQLVPFRPDIVNISFTCRDLREAVLPILFRNLTLRLRWVDGALAEPGLFCLRQKCPHLIRYTKCVYVDTLFGHFRDPRSMMRSFGIPKELQQWLDSISPPSDRTNTPDSPEPHDAAKELSERLLATSSCRDLLQNAAEDVQTRFKSIAYTLSEQVLSTPGVFRHNARSSLRATDTNDLLGDETFYDYAREEARLAAREPNRSRELRFKLDAFFVLLLSFPYRLTSLVFESFPTDRMDILQSRFALQFAALTFQIYGGQLKELTMKMTPVRGPNPISHRTADDVDAEVNILSNVIPSLETVQRLRLSAGGRPHQLPSTVANMSHWYCIAENMTQLDLRDSCGDANSYLSFVEKFTNLQHLTLGDITLWQDNRMPGRQVRTPPSPAITWLAFLIELRRRLPHVALDLKEPELGSKACLSASGVRWLLQEAVPRGAHVDFERETRLTEDIESFFPLWMAEDSVRGWAAEEARRDGGLVDLAMSSRWRGLFPGARRS